MLWAMAEDQVHDGHVQAWHPHINAFNKASVQKSVSKTVKFDTTLLIQLNRGIR